MPSIDELFDEVEATPAQTVSVDALFDEIEGQPTRSSIDSLFDEIQAAEMPADDLDKAFATKAPREVTGYEGFEEMAEDVVGTGKAGLRGIQTARQAALSTGVLNAQTASQDAKKAATDLAAFDAQFGPIAAANPLARPNLEQQRKRLEGRVAQFAGEAQQRGAEVPDSLSGIASAERIKQSLPATGGLKEFYEGDWKKALVENPVEVIAGLITESLPVSAPAMVGTIAAGPVGGAAITGASSFATEKALSVIDSMREAGVDVTSPEAMQSFLQDEQKVEAAKERATARGVPIAVFDALTAGLAGKILKPVVKAGGSKPAIAAALVGETAMQGVGGAGGETVAQLSTEGAITDPRSIAAEAITEGGTLPGELYGSLSRAPIETPSETPRADYNANADVVRTDTEVLSEVDGVVQPIAPESPKAKSLESLLGPEVVQPLEQETEVETEEVISEPAVDEPTPEPDQPAPETPIEEAPEPEEAASEPEQRTRSRDDALTAAYQTAQDVASRVAFGQGDIVQEAARDAAFENARRSIEATGSFNPQFMAREAQRVAGQRRAESVQQDEDETGEMRDEGESGQSPQRASMRSEYIGVVRDALKAFEPDEIQILMTAGSSGAQTTLAEELGITRQAVSQRFKRLSARMQDELIARGLSREDAISVGPGAANMAEFPDQRTTSTKNAVVDQERINRGEEPIMAPARQALGVPWEQAEQAIERDPNTGSRLVQDILNQPRAVTAFEEAILLHSKITAQNNAKLAMDRMLAEDSTPEEKEQALRDFTGHLNDLDSLDQATRSIGTEWGRAGRFRQQLARDDYTLAMMVQKRRASKGGEDLTAKELAETKALHDRIAAAEKKLADLEAQEKAREAKYVFQSLLKDQAREVRTAAKEGKSLLDTLKSSHDEALKSLRSKMARTSAGVDPSILYDVARIGAYHIANGAVKIAEFTAKVVSDVGEWIRPHIDEVFELSSNIHKASQSAFKTPGAPKQQPQTAIDELKAASAANEKLDPRLIYDLAREKVRGGMKVLNEVMKAVHADVEPLFPGTTEREVRDAFSGYGKALFPSKAEDLVKLRELRALARLTSAIEDAQARIAPKKSGPQRDRPTQAVREKMRELQVAMREAGIETTSPEDQIRSANAARATALRNQIEDLDKQLRTGEKPSKASPLEPTPEVERLRSERDAMREQLREIEEAEKVRPTAEEAQLAKDKKMILARIKKLQERIAANDYAPRVKSERPTDAEKEKLLFELQQAKEKFNRARFEAELARRSVPKKIFDTGREIINTARAILTSFDLSGVFRQGGISTLSHPVKAAKAIPSMLRAFRSEQGQFAAMEEIRNRPNFRSGAYQRAKLEFTDLGENTPSKMEEAFMSRWAGRIPFVAGSGRAYITFLNRIRADLFDSMTKSLSVSGKPTPTESIAIANFINISTGRGKLPGRMNASAALMNTIFFAPKLVVSRFQFLLLQPFYRGSFRTRKVILNEYARFLIGAGIVYRLAIMAQDDDDDPLNLDLTSADFAKVRFGETRLDPMSGLLQATVFLSREYEALRMALTKEKEKRPKYGTGFEVIVRFLRTKLSPVVGSTVNVLDGKDVVGHPATPASESVKLVTPMSFKDIYEVMQEQGAEKGSAISLLMLFGMGAQTHQPKEKK